MKLWKFMLPLAFAMTVTMSQAQTKSSAVTDEDLKKYVVTMDSVKGMQETLMQIISERVQKNTVMSVSRYNELFKIEKDEAKLKEKNATPEEIAFLQEIAGLREENLKRINTAYQALAKEYVGLKAFNTIHKTLQSDSTLKARYEALAKEDSGNATGE